MNKLKVLLLLSLTFTCSLQAQVMRTDSVVVAKRWIDKNGTNDLRVNVYAACNNYDAYLTSPDGHPSVIDVSLKNDRHTLEARFGLETLDDFALTMLMFYGEGIWFHDLKGIQAVFIPVFYCAMMDSEMKLSYIVLYNDKQHIYHFTYYYDQESEVGRVTLMEEDLDKKLKDLPSELRVKFKDYLLSNYTTVEDLVPNDKTLEQEKFCSQSKIAVSTPYYYANYPYLMLQNIAELISERKYEEALPDLKNFKSLYIDGLDEQPDEDLYDIMEEGDPERNQEWGREFTIAEDYINAYLCYWGLLKYKLQIE